MDGKNVVLMSMVGSGAIVVLDDVRTDGISGKHLLALGVVYIALSATQDVAPKVAVPFALLVFSGITLTKGAKVFDSLGNAVSGDIKVPGYKEHPSTLVPLGATNSADSGTANKVFVPPRKAHRTTGPSGVQAAANR